MTGWGGVPKMGVRDSAASMNSLVAIALFLSASTGTSTKERLKVLASKKVPPGGITGADMMAGLVVLVVSRRSCVCGGGWDGSGSCQCIVREERRCSELRCN